VPVHFTGRPSADFLGDHADLFRRHAEHGRELVAHDRRALRARIEVIHPLFRQVRGEASARLHRISDHARVVDAQPHHPGCILECFLRQCLVAGFEIQNDIARHALVDERRAGSDGLLRRDHRRQFPVFDADELGRVLRRERVLGDHERDRVAGEAHASLRERGPTGVDQLCSAAAFHR
jgi:hypothetical protein